MKCEINLEQKQILNQNQLQSLELLALCNAELESYMQNEFLENPMIEKMDPAVSYSQPAASHTTDPKYQLDIADRNDLDLHTYLLEQLDLRMLKKGDRRIIDILISCLDDNGYFTTPLTEVAAMAGATIKQTADCLEWLKDLEPFGIFAKDLSECLAIQLDAMGMEDDALYQMVADHLEDISIGRISNITRALGLSSLQVRRYIAVIETLNPKPLAGLCGAQSEYMIPDILIEKSEGEWLVSINDEWYGNYKLNDYYLRMMQASKETELVEYFRKKLERARFLFSSIEQRRRTMLRISEAILLRQNDFFALAKPLKPMTMAEIAGDIGVSISTVSRAVKGKYIGHPGGTVLIKSLFCSNAVKQPDEEMHTVYQIKEEIRQLIVAENKQKPLSDQKIMEQLKGKGIHISRRAVTKYREAVGIKGSFERKIV